MQARQCIRLVYLYVLGKREALSETVLIVMRYESRLAAQSSFIRVG